MIPRPPLARPFGLTCKQAVWLVLVWSLFENSPMTVSHTARHARCARTDELFICCQQAGRIALEQDGREAVLEAGDFTLIDPRIAYTGRFFADSRTLIVKFDRDLLKARVGNTREMTVVPVKSADEDNSFVSELIGLLPHHADRLSAVAGDLVMNQVLDLFAVTLTNTMKYRSPRISSAKALICVKLRAVIDARLTDPALDATAVASAAGISVRYANTALAEVSTSIMRLVLARRLAECRKALEDPSQAHRSVSEIAYGWGFSDLSTFGRNFRTAYGMRASDYRKQTQVT